MVRGHGLYTFTATGLPTGLSTNRGTILSGYANGEWLRSDDTVSDHRQRLGTRERLNCSVTVSVAGHRLVARWITAVQGVAITPVTLSAQREEQGTGYTFTARGCPADWSYLDWLGTISGTPTVSGTFSYTVTITEAPETRER